jgi:hypothetical protein
LPDSGMGTISALSSSLSEVKHAAAFCLPFEGRGGNVPLVRRSGLVLDIYSRLVVGSVELESNESQTILI